MANSIQKKMQLILEYMDKGYHSGVDTANKKTEALKKTMQNIVKQAAIAAAAFVGLTAALMKFIQKGAEVRSVTDTWEGFLKSAHMTPDTLDRVRAAINGTVSDMQMMRSSVQALATGLEPERLIEFWEKAKQMGDVMSKSTLEVFEGLTRAYNKMEPEALETIGITIRTTQVYKDYAEQLGKTAEQLTLKDRKMAFSMAIEREYQKNFKAVGNVTTEVREKFQSFIARLENARDRFYEIVATSPKVQAFLDYLIDKLGLTNDELEKNDGQIQKFVDNLIVLIQRSIELADIIWKNKELAASLGVGFITLTKTGNPLIALFAAVATAAVLCFKKISHAAIDLGTLIYTSLIDFNNRWIEALASKAERIPKIGKMIAEGLRGEIEKGLNIKDWLIEQGEQNKELIDKYAPPNLLLNWITGGGGEAPTGPKTKKEEPGGDWSAAKYMALEKSLDTEVSLIGDFEDQKVQLYQSTAYQKVEIAQWAADLEMDIAEWEYAKVMESYQQRVDAYRSGYFAMSQYSAAFFNDSARRGRTLNAMMIAGFGEMVAAYIDAKTAQAKIDVMEGTYQALKFLAMGDFRGAALMAQAAAGAGMIAGAGIIAAGAVRSWSQGKAEGLMTEQETAWEKEASGERDLAGQRRQATGIVNTRPIAINVYSTANFNAGYMIFGDSEAAANDLYENCFRDRIDGDVESGMIAV